MELYLRLHEKAIKKYLDYYLSNVKNFVSREK